FQAAAECAAHASGAVSRDRYRPPGGYARRARRAARDAHPAVGDGTTRRWGQMAAHVHTAHTATGHHNRSGGADRARAAGGDVAGPCGPGRRPGDRLGDDRRQPSAPQVNGTGCGTAPRRRVRGAG
ncbi:MAG: hypothetical protein ACK56F_05370, partial [bacterium]